MSLSTTIKAIQDIMRKDVGVDGDAQRIGQLTWLLFLKIWDDREQELELIEEGFQSPLVDVAWRDAAGQPRAAGDLRWRTWAADPEGLTGDGLLGFVEGTLFPALKGLEVGPAVVEAGEGTSPAQLRKRRLLLRGVFEDAYQYMKSGTLLRQVVNRLQSDVDFNDARNRHLFGEIYEQVLRDLQNAGNAGEYYTPRAVTQFAVEMVHPRLGEVVLDPACGTGGFLSGAIEHVRRGDVHTAQHEALLQSSIRGIEKKPLPHLLSVTNMVLHGLDVPTGVRRANALGRPLRDISSRDRVDVIVTNPPFGGQEEDGIEANFPLDFRTRETADLFLLLIIESLKPGGRAAVVLPDGSLFGEGIKTRIKDRLLAECDLHTIVRLPAGVFAPYTSIRTNILFFEKGRPTEHIWYFEHPYPVGYKSYSKTKPIGLAEFDLEKEWWDDRREGPHAWRVSVEDIRARGLNLDVPNPNTERSEREDPDTLLVGVDTCEREIDALVRAVGAELRDALGTSTWPRAAERVGELGLHEDGTKRLRELVLSLAVRGRLVPQRAPSVSATARTIAATQRDTPTGTSDSSDRRDLPWLVPSGWDWTTLGAICQFRIGRTPPTKDAKYWATGSESGYTWIAISDMEHYRSVDGSKRRVSETARLEVFRSAPEPAGTMLMSFKLTIGKIGRLAVPAYHNEAIVALTPALPTLDPYLFRVLPIFAQRGETNAAIKGATLNASSLASLQIAVPPPEEQARVVEAIDKVLGLLDELDGALSRRALARTTLERSVLRHVADGWARPD